MDSIINKAKGAMSGSSGTATGPSTNQGNVNTGTNTGGQDYGDKGAFSSFLLVLYQSSLYLSFVVTCVNYFQLWTGVGQRQKIRIRINHSRRTGIRRINGTRKLTMNLALDMLEKKTGHQMGAGTNEKITDGLRGAYEKQTGYVIFPSPHPILFAPCYRSTSPRSPFSSFNPILLSQEHPH
jgi:hypothetical protein